VDIVVDDQVQRLPPEVASSGDSGEIFGEYAGVPQPGLVAGSDDRAFLKGRGSQPLGALADDEGEGGQVSGQGAGGVPVVQRRLHSYVHVRVRIPASL
jgi:hypothetical protein